jgi:iron-sulfur cluster assembly protein
MIHVSEKAAVEMRKLLAHQHPEASGLRLGVKAGGCSGFEYVFAWEPAPREGDLVFEGPQGVRVWIDPRSHRLLDGTTLTYDTNLISRGFVFENPNAKSTCGCGTSFSVEASGH